MLAFVPEFLIPVVILILAAVTFATVFSIRTKRDAVRRKAMETLAGGMSAAFSETDAFGLTQQLNQFSLFKRERKRFFRTGKISNVLRSNVGETEVYLFDYSFLVSTGKSSKRVSQTVFFANDKNWYLPNFHLKPEGWWHKILSGIGVEKDINFQENMDFSDKFWLKSEFESIVRQKFTPALQQFMLQKPPGHIEGNNYYLIAYKPGKLLDPVEAKAFFENCCALTKIMQTEGKLELLQLVEMKQVNFLQESVVLPTTQQQTEK